MGKIKKIILLVGTMAVLSPLYLNCAGGFSISEQNLSSQAVNNNSESMNGWRPMKIGAGGWLTGLDISNDGSTKVVRADTMGAYIWDASNQRWNLITTANSMPAEDVGIGKASGVYEIRVAPNQPSRLYMVWANRVFRTDNYGARWTRTTFNPVPLNPNSSMRMSGQKMVVDPNNPDVVYLGTPESGLFVTFDGGANWNSVPAVSSVANAAQGISGLAIDPHSGIINGRSKVVYASGSGNGVYRSIDGGATFVLLNGGPKDVFHAKIANDGTYYVIGDKASRIWRFSSDSWTEISPFVSDWSTIVTDPANSNRIIAARQGGGLSISKDRGATWSKNLPATRTATDIPWLAWTNESYMSTGDMMIDPSRPNQIWFSQGIGVWTYDLSENPTSVNWVSKSAGIEQLCPNQLVVPPGGKPILGSWDRPVFRSENPEVYPLVHGPDNATSIQMGWSVDYASSDPNFIVALINWAKEASSFSNDGGKTWSHFPSYPPLFANGKTGGGIAASTPTNIVWFPSNKGNPYYTKDGGHTWLPITMPGVDTIGEIGWGWAYYFKRHIVAADRVLANTFYAYNYLKGTYRSTDGGATWTHVSSRIFTYSGYHAKLRSVPGQAGHLFFTSGTQGSAWDHHPVRIPLSRSVDGGQTWMDVPDVYEVLAFGFGKAIPPDAYPTIFIAGWVKDAYGIYRSTDNAQTWEKIGDYPYGNMDSVITMDGDMDLYGRVYLGLGGSGYAYGQFN